MKESGATPSIVDEFVAQFGIDEELLFPEMKSLYRELRGSGDLKRRRQIMFREFFYQSKVFYALEQEEKVFVDVILDRLCRNLNLSRADYFVSVKGELELMTQRGLSQRKKGDVLSIRIRDIQFQQKLLHLDDPSNDPEFYDVMMVIRNKKGRIIRVIGLDPREKITAEEAPVYEHLAVMLNFIIGKKVYDDQRMNIDPLTDYYNRGYLMRAQEGFYEDAEVMALVDFDNFKSINTRFGYAGGDKAIRFITSFIEDRIRDADFGRWGGEEFVIFFRGKNLSVDVIRERCQKIIEELSQTTVPDIGESITCSMGLIRYERKLSIEENIKRANTPLTKAKDGGKRLALVE